MVSIERDPETVLAGLTPDVKKRVEKLQEIQVHCLLLICIFSLAIYIRVSDRTGPNRTETDIFNFTEKT